MVETSDCEPLLSWSVLMDSYKRWKLIIRGACTWKGPLAANQLNASGRPCTKIPNSRIIHVLVFTFYVVSFRLTSTRKRDWNKSEEHLQYIGTSSGLMSRSYNLLQLFSCRTEGAQMPVYVPWRPCVKNTIETMHTMKVKHSYSLLGKYHISSI